MEQTYLSGTIQERIREQMAMRDMNQAQLARIIGIGESTFSRFMSGGKSAKLDHQYVIRIAREFKVSTDFLLGITNVPDRKNYRIDELGLTPMAARNLYTKRVNTSVVSYLLENPKFAFTTNRIARYLEGSLIAGIVAQNQLYDSVASILMGYGYTQGAQDVRSKKRQPTEPDLSEIQKAFIAAVREIQRDVKLEVAAKTATEEEFNRVLAEVTQGQDLRKVTITPEQFSQLITHEFDKQDLLKPETKEQLRQALIAVAEDLKQDDETARHEQ